MNKKNKKRIKRIIFIILLCLLIIKMYQSGELYTLINKIFPVEKVISKEAISYELQNIPDYSKEAYVIINNNEPNFDENYLTTTSFEKYSELDYLGRCGSAFANISIDTMPTE